MTKVEYRLAWSRTYLKKVALIVNSSRGVWTLSDSEIKIEKVSSDKIVKTVREQTKKSKFKKLIKLVTRIAKKLRNRWKMNWPILLRQKKKLKSKESKAITKKIKK